MPLNDISTSNSVHTKTEIHKALLPTALQQAHNQGRALQFHNYGSAGPCLRIQAHTRTQHRSTSGSTYTCTDTITAMTKRSQQPSKHFPDLVQEFCHIRPKYNLDSIVLRKPARTKEEFRTYTPHPGLIAVSAQKNTIYNFTGLIMSLLPENEKESKVMPAFWQQHRSRHIPLQPHPSLFLHALSAPERQPAPVQPLTQDPPPFPVSLRAVHSVTSCHRSLRTCLRKQQQTKPACTQCTRGTAAVAAEHRAREDGGHAPHDDGSVRLKGEKMGGMALALRSPGPGRCDRPLARSRLRTSRTEAQQSRLESIGHRVRQPLVHWWGGGGLGGRRCPPSNGMAPRPSMAQQDPPCHRPHGGSVHPRCPACPLLFD